MVLLKGTFKISHCERKCDLICDNNIARTILEFQRHLFISDHKWWRKKSFKKVLKHGNHLYSLSGIFEETNLAKEMPWLNACLMLWRFQYRKAKKYIYIVLPFLSFGALAKYLLCCLKNSSLLSYRIFRYFFLSFICTELENWTSNHSQKVCLKMEPYRQE